MNTIKIDDRLKEIASLVDKCDIVADIGTDHGYLSIYLILNDIAKHVIASDVAINPLNSALENISSYNLNDKIDTILCNGLDKINSNTDCIVIAGMGGYLIIDILSKRKYDYKSYVLQANIHHYSLRKYLASNNFKIIDEKVVFVAKKYYEIIKVVHGAQSLSENQLIFGPINLIKKDPTFINKWRERKEKLENVLIDFKGNDIEKDKIVKEVNKINDVINGVIVD